MNISEDMQNKLTKQVMNEFQASHLYLSMAAHFEKESLTGFATWMKKQAEEERTHALKIFDFILERGGNVHLDSIPAPKTEWKNPVEVFEDAHKHEVAVTGKIHELVEHAQKEKDHATSVFLQWFVTEQVEEEDTSSEIVDRLKMLGDSRSGLIMLDQELGKRE